MLKPQLHLKGNALMFAQKSNLIFSIILKLELLKIGKTQALYYLGQVDKMQIRKLFKYKKLKISIIIVLLKANYQDKNWQGKIIPAGSFITGRRKMAQELDMTEQQVRTAFSNLQSTHEITIKSYR